MRQRRPPVDELINAFEFEELAKAVLPPAVFSTIAGSDRTALDRLTFRPRMMVPTLDLDLSVELFGRRHFTPIIVGPVADQRRYHQGAEAATARGATAANTAVIVSSRASLPLAEIAAKDNVPLWYAIYAEDLASSDRKIQEAVAAGAAVLCVTIGGGNADRAAPSRINWSAIDRVRPSARVPLVIKGIGSAAQATSALEHGAQGVVVSSHAASQPAPIEVLPSIVDVVAGKAAVLVDGSFRRGSDLLKALILGARAVLVSRPVMWGLASYGADGVRAVLELLQNDLARQFGAIGASNQTKLTRDMVRLHKR